MEKTLNNLKVILEKSNPIMEYFTSISKLRQRSDGKEKASWFFLTIEKEVSEKIKSFQSQFPRKGRGSVRVRARVGYFSRETSIFPDNASACYLLPVKASVRKELKLREGDTMRVELDLL